MKQIYFYLFVKCKLFFFFLISILIPSQLKNLETHLVTGATGLVGMHIVFDLLSQNKKVCATFTKNSNRNIIKNVFTHYGFSNYYDKINWIKMDLEDVTEVYQAIEGVDFVYHSGAIVSFNKSDYELMRKINIDGTTNIVNACLEHKIKKLAFISSVASIGRDGKREYSEKNKWSSGKENSFYALTKYKAENEVWRGIEEGLNAVITNPGIIIGPSDWGRSSTTIFKQIHKGLSYFPLGINGFVDVRDVARATVALMDSKISGERYILVGENLSYQSVFDDIALSLNRPKPDKKATKSILEIAWRLEAIRCFISNKKQSITKETARTSNQVNIYKNQKIINALNYNFNPIKEAISNTSNFLLKFK